MKWISEEPKEKRHKHKDKQDRVLKYKKRQNT